MKKEHPAFIMADAMEATQRKIKEINKRYASMGKLNRAQKDAWEAEVAEVKALSWEEIKHLFKKED